MRAAADPARSGRSCWRDRPVSSVAGQKYVVRPESISKPREMKMRARRRRRGHMDGAQRSRCGRRACPGLERVRRLIGTQRSRRAHSGRASPSSQRATSECSVSRDVERVGSSAENLEPRNDDCAADRTRLEPQMELEREIGRERPGPSATAPPMSSATPAYRALWHIVFRSRQRRRARKG